MAIMSVTLALGASAQRGGSGKGGFYRGGHTRVIIAPRYGFGYGGFGYAYPYSGFSLGFGYPFFNYPYGYGFAPHYNSSYRLSNQIAAIRNDYKYRIKAARRDKSVSRSQRKQNVLELKSERERAIANAQMNYRQGRMNMNNQNRGMNNNQNPGTNNNQNPGTNNNQNPGTNNNQNPTSDDNQNS